MREQEDYYHQLGWIAPVEDTYQNLIQDIRNDIKWGFGFPEFPLEWEVVPGIKNE